MFNWRDVAKALGTTAVIVAVLGYLSKTAIEEYLKHDMLQRLSNQKLAEFKEQLEEQAKKKERIRYEIIRWSNPILSAVNDLENRLRNILKDDGYLALSVAARDKVNPQWSIRYNYFLPSTVYLMSRYFCWTGLLEEKLSFELFETQDDKDAFLDKIRTANRKLATFPMQELKNIKDEKDQQIFGLEERSMGELLRSKDETRCMNYSEFLEKWSEPTYRQKFEPLASFIDGIEPSRQRPWRRLSLMQCGLIDVQYESRKILGLAPANTLKSARKTAVEQCLNNMDQ